MGFNYKFNIKDGMFKYKCITYGSYIEIRAKDVKKIYNILNILDVLEKQAAENRKNCCIFNGFEILFDCNRYIKIDTISNWLSIKEEVPIIKRELSKNIKEYDKDNVKDIIIKIKSLNKGSSNIIKEDLKWEKLLFQEK